MTNNELQAILTHVKYKPGSSIWLDVENNLHVKQHIFDMSTGLFTRDTLTINWKIHPELIQTPEQFLCVVQQVVSRWEQHEAHEWLKYQGKLVYNTHALNI